MGWGQVRVDGLIGWATLVAHAAQQDPPEPDPRPNTRGWEHLGNLVAPSEQLAAAFGWRRPTVGPHHDLEGLALVLLATDLVLSEDVAGRSGNGQRVTNGYRRQPLRPRLTI